jgi:hypothetical protein
MKKIDQLFVGKYGLAGPQWKGKRVVNHLLVNMQMATNGPRLIVSW